MPRRKPDSVNVTRVELGPWEREHFGPYLQAQANKPYLDFVSQIMRDVSAILLIAGFLTLLLPSWLPADWRDTLGMTDDPVGLRATLKDWFEIQNLVGIAGGAWAGAWAGSIVPGIGNVLGAILGAISGWTAVEVGEDVLEAAQQAQAEAALAAAQNAEDAQITWTAVLIRTVLMLEKVGHRTGPL